MSQNNSSLIGEFSSLDSRIAETKENIRRLNVTLTKTYFHPQYLEHCRGYLAHYETVLEELKSLKKAKEKSKL
ncbi:TPA: hypothetical protein I7256_20695 [Vibrio vulnificus]|nr:hypothetical protein [Vibrio vulnificus]HAS6414936.1 hypothetical protein [Vibrio vulnificus]